MIDINLFLKFLRDKKNNHFFKKIYEMGGKLSALQHWLNWKKWDGNDKKIKLNMGRSGSAEVSTKSRGILERGRGTIKKIKKSFEGLSTSSLILYTGNNN